MSDWTEVYDDSSGKYYYYNASTGETSWDIPTDYVQPAEVVAADAGNGDWLAVYDESSAKYYYHNSVTGEVQWEPPAGFSHPSADSATVDTTVDGAVSQPAVSALPEGWTEVYDESSQRTYYYNPDTGETSWDMPVAIDLGLDQSYADQAIASTDTVHWIEHYDESSGRTFYEHPDTHETQWHSPYESGHTEAQEDTHTDSNAANDNNSVTSKSKMSLYNSSELNLPNLDASPMKTAHDKSGTSTSTPKGGRSGYVFAPDEFTNEFMNLGNKAGPKSPSRASRASSYDEHDGLSDDEQHDEEVALVDDIMRSIDHHVDWTDVSASANITEHIASNVSESHYASPILLARLAKKLNTFTMVKFAENYFQFDRRGNQVLANTLDKLISHQSDVLRTSLTSMNSTLSAEAVTCFKQVQLFMSESMKNSQTHTDIALSLIQKLLVAPAEFHDEIYLQLMKQTRKNPSQESTELGWQLLLMVVSSIPPSKRILPFLLFYCSFNMESLHDEAKKFASFTMKISLKSALSEIRKELPTMKEIQSLLLGEEVEMKVQSIHGLVLTIKVDSFTLIKQFESMIAKELNIQLDFYHLFALFEYRHGVERLLNTSDRVLDVISTWDKASMAADAQSPQQPTKDATLSQIYLDFEQHLGHDFFLFKVHLYFPLKIEQDLVTKHMLVAQALQDVLSAQYPHTLQDAFLLAALQLQILHGDYVVGKEIKEFRSLSLLKRILSIIWLEASDVPITKHEIESRIVSLYKKLVGMNAEAAMTMFLSYVSAWKLYGGKYYVVKGQLDNSGHFTHDLVLSITARSVIIVDIHTSTFLAEYSYEQIYSWGHSFESFVLVIGSKSSQVKSYFRTAQGKEIDEILKVYASNGNPSGAGGDMKDTLNTSLTFTQ